MRMKVKSTRLTCEYSHLRPHSWSNYAKPWKKSGALWFLAVGRTQLAAGWADDDKSGWVGGASLLWDMGHPWLGDSPCMKLAAGVGVGCWKRPAARSCTVSLPQAPVSLLLSVEQRPRFYRHYGSHHFIRTEASYGLISLNTDATCVL